MSMAGEQPPTPTRSIKKDSQRSRKGCPECRSRKIKCDEQTPECGQCLKGGRVCRIIDSIFKPHSYSFLPAPANETTSADSRQISSPAKGPDVLSPQHARDSLQFPLELLNERQDHHHATDNPATCTEYPARDPSLSNGCSPISQHNAQPSAIFYHAPSQDDDTYEDRCEITFFLRHFSEGPGRWMDVYGGQSYFSQQIVLLAHRSPLVRYAACALAAKQLGQTRHPESHIRQTNTQRLMLKTLIATKLGFTWYGAKYYERAIQLLAKQISKKDRISCSLSPNYIYRSELTPQSADFSVPKDQDDDAAPFRILAACILCQYEDVNATIRAWSGHLDGVHRLLRPHLYDPTEFKACSQILQPASALDAVFWFFVLHDMLNCFVTRRRTRIDPEDISLWRNMGLPLDDHGRLSDHSRKVQSEIILFKALVWLMCQLVNSDLSSAMQWMKMNDDFDRWENMVPSSFYIPIAWPPATEPNHANAEAFEREIWFTSDLSAITLAFYHMARIILLIHRPMELFIQQSRSQDDILSTYNTLQHGLRQHAIEIIPIMHAMPSETVRKYMLQPLYVAGRSLIDDKERRALLQILRDMADDFGLFTDYRIKDLCEEWGMPYNGIDRKDGHGIIT
ncbi:hypothetical protein BDW59DRAFT_69656 [Aspergillus cavernicola]|uniref:Zn(2)-C6 fungal-type domain-containing protein n=1 Tax=Aspergillus cavernicola TaxID=176166 RepID=A0ABR4IFR3_9EURO